MRRRVFLMGLASATALPAVSRAQQPATAVVGLLHITTPEGDAALVAALCGGLADFGFFEGKNLTIEYRWANNDPARLPALADDLVRRRVNVIVALGGATTAQAAKAATATVPIVFAAPPDPVELGFVASISRPGGNLTGVAGFTHEVAQRRLEQLHQLVPQASTIGALTSAFNTTTTDIFQKTISAAANVLGLQIYFVTVDTEAELESVFAALAERRVGALLADTNPPLMSWRNHFVALAARHRIPTSYARREFVEAGGLVSYGAELIDMYRQAGGYIGRILKGEKPADLPIIQPVKFELVLNLNTAKALGLSVPTDLLALADRVIE
jgi:putative tryptophan/tyrosine transport system substrate-binding protein